MNSKSKIPIIIGIVVILVVIIAIVVYFMTKKDGVETQRITVSRNNPMYLHLLPKYVENLKKFDSRYSIGSFFNIKPEGLKKIFVNNLVEITNFTSLSSDVLNYHSTKYQDANTKILATCTKDYNGHVDSIQIIVLYDTEYVMTWAMTGSMVPDDVIELVMNKNNNTTWYSSTYGCGLNNECLDKNQAPTYYRMNGTHIYDVLQTSPLIGL
jgi:hypothetical protein